MSARQTTELAKQGIELTRQARAAEDEASRKDDVIRESEERARVTAMSPYLIMSRDLGSRTFVVSNFGLGPAFIYQADYVAAGKTFTFKWEDRDEPDAALDEFIAAATTLHDAPDTDPDQIDTISVTLPISAGEKMKFLSFGPSYDDPYGKRFSTWAKMVGIRFCYTNLVGTHKGSVENLPPDVTPQDCPEPPDIVTITVNKGQ